jgi:hypothetical protein
MAVLAWHNDHTLKAEAVAAMRAHRDADELIRGTYLESFPESPSGFKGCFHGCLTTGRLAAEQGISVVEFVRTSYPEGWHADGERLWGIPVRLGSVLDKLFESLPEGWSDFAVDSVEAMPVGADLDAAVDRWLLDLLVDPERGVVAHTAEGSAQRAAVDAVAALYRRRIEGDEPTRDEWRSATAAAAYATAAAAYAAANASYDASYDADAADAVYASYAAANTAYAAANGAANADDASYAAANAAYVADAASYAAANAADVAAAAARDRHFARLADRLLHHLRNAPILATA